MKREISVVVRRTGFQAYPGVAASSEDHKCRECLGLQCNSCRPIYLAGNDCLPAAVGRELIARERR